MLNVADLNDLLEVERVTRLYPDRFTPKLKSLREWLGHAKRRRFLSGEPVSKGRLVERKKERRAPYKTEL